MEREAVLKKIILLLLIQVFVNGLYAQSGLKSSDDWLTIIDKACVYDNKNHAAFTSLREWKGNMYLAFREGKHHVAKGDNGQIKVMKKTSQGWESQHVFSLEGVDLRDPDLLILNGRLFLYTLDMHYAELTEKGWTDLKVVERNAPGNPAIWKKRVFKDTAYGYGYRWNNWPLLMKSVDGVKWDLVRECRFGGNSNEADMIFVADTMYICMRVDTPPGSCSLWGKSVYPFSECNFSVMNISLASPEMYVLSDNTFLLVGREYDWNSITLHRDVYLSLYKIDKNGNIQKRYVIEENCKDMGYASFYKGKNDTFVMSYYVGDTDFTKIFLLTFQLRSLVSR